MCIRRLFNGVAADVAGGVSTFTSPPIAVGRIIEIGILGAVHDFAVTAVLKIPSIARPWDAIAFAIQERILGNLNGRARLVPDFKATVASPI